MKIMTRITMRNIVLIIPTLFKMLLIFNYKLCQAPTTLLKGKKIQMEGERLLCGVSCVDHPSPSFIVVSWRSGSDKYGNLSEPPPHTAVQPPEETGLGPRRLVCGRTQASLPGHCLWLVGWWMGLGPSCGGAWPRCLHEGGLLQFFWLRTFKNTPSALRFVSLFVYFYLFLGMCPAKHVSPKTSRTRSKYMHTCQSLFTSSVFGL
jgi:hypothetical protein